jgi:hypothetical protein
MPQTVDPVAASWSVPAAAVIGWLRPQPYDRRIVLMAIRGPVGSTLDIYRGWLVQDHSRLTRVYPAQSRTYDAAVGAAPIVIYAGEAATFVWTGGQSGAGQTALATVTSEYR